jgi:hypothetical protein
MLQLFITLLNGVKHTALVNKTTEKTEMYLSLLFICKRSSAKCLYERRLQLCAILGSLLEFLVVLLLHEMVELLAI